MLSPGPPLVIAYTTSKEVMRHMVKNMLSIRMFLEISGSVMLKKERMLPAPSILAASYMSEEMNCRPANTRMAKKGRSFHRSTAITALRAVLV
ncbi:hypothetical protein D3C73_1329710 [compost metagenome]